MRCSIMYLMSFALVITSQMRLIALTLLLPGGTLAAVRVFIFLVRHETTIFDKSRTSRSAWIFLVAVDSFAILLGITLTAFYLPVAWPLLR